MKDSIEIQIKLEMQETVDEFIYKAIEPFAETIIGRVSKEEMKQILMRGTRKGRWIDHKDEYLCSACQNTVIADVYDGEWGSNGIYEYCPYCGAKMEGVGDGTD